VSAKVIYITKKDKERIAQLMLFCDLFMEEDRKRIRKLYYDASQGCVISKDLIPTNIVMIYSKILLKDTVNNEQLTITLVFPEEADEEQNRVSVHTPLGTALIGSKTGDIIEYERPNGIRRLIIKKTSYLKRMKNEQTDNEPLV